MPSWLRPIPSLESRSTAVPCTPSSIRIPVDRDWRDESAWFCSELKAWCLEDAGFFPYTLLISKNRVTPADLLLMVNPWVINGETFWQPIPGLVLGASEI